MSWRVRPARADDLDAMLELARLSGGGMTNLPNDAGTLRARLDWSAESFAKTVTEPQDEVYILVLEEPQKRQVVGTASILSRIGARWPFYSYKLGRVTHVSQELKRTVAMQILHLVNDLEGGSEVVGLFVHPDFRHGGVAALLARSRYLFIAGHRERFSDRIVADIRGRNVAGHSPFWDAVAKPFFGGEFDEADRYNAIHGNQFIADLMPRYPVYVAMLPEAAAATIGKAHDASVPAQKMLEAEGFEWEGYVDIFDAGPTLTVRAADLRTVRDSISAPARKAPAGFELAPHLIAAGDLVEFHVWRGDAAVADGAALLSAEAMGDLADGAIVRVVKA
jgi:arginine N-succinyltransferase